MEYYCKRYKFGKPDIDCSHATQKSKKGKSATSWEAIMTVGGRKIGMGSASAKKAAQIKCYLDVTQYLESCDAVLWKDFIEHSKKDPSADLGTAPHLMFLLSDHLNDEVYGLCGDIRQSSLYKNAPASGIVETVEPLLAWTPARASNRASEAELDEKSRALQEKLTAYNSDPKLDKSPETFTAGHVESYRHPCQNRGQRCDHCHGRYGVRKDDTDPSTPIRRLHQPWRRCEVQHHLHTASSSGRHVCR